MIIRLFLSVCIFFTIILTDSNCDPVLNESKYSGLGNNIPELRVCLETIGSNPWKYLIDPVSNLTYYNILNHQWNTRKEKVYPFAYFLPISTQDVQGIVRCARWLGIQVVPNSGGHSFESLSFGNNHTLIIDFRLMNSVQLLPDGVTALIEPGALLSTIYAQLWIQGKRFLPSGICLTVGLGGHIIGGGIGYLEPVYGLALDNLLEVEMVSAKGDIVLANSSLNPDLFWALRGVGPGLIGIATRFRVQTFDAGNIKLSTATIIYPLENFPTAFSAIQSWYHWVQQNNQKVNLAVNIADANYTSQFTYSYPGIVIGLVYAQDDVYNPTDNYIFLQGVNEIFANSDPKPQIIYHTPTFLELVFSLYFYTPVNFILSNGSVVQTGQLSDHRLDSDPYYSMINGATFEEMVLRRLLALKKEMAVERFVKVKSFYISKDLSDVEIIGFNEVVQRIPHNQATIFINSEFGVNQGIPSDSTAYVHRNVRWNLCITVESIPEYGDTSGAMKWIQDLSDVSRTFNSGETYQNYPDFDLDDHFERNYKENFPKLVECKRRWDPMYYFNWTYSIPAEI